MATSNPPLCVVKNKRHAEHIEAQALSSLPGRSRGEGFRQPQTELTLEFAITAPGHFNAVGKGGASGWGIEKFFVLAGKTLFGPPALKGLEAVIANSKISSVSGGYAFLF